MIRSLTGAAVGTLVGLLTVAAWAAEFGYREGVSSRSDLTPGWETAGITALYCTALFGWAAGLAGAAIGGTAGLLSTLVRRRA